MIRKTGLIVLAGILSCQVAADQDALAVYASQAEEISTLLMNKTNNNLQLKTAMLMNSSDAVAAQVKAAQPDCSRMVAGAQEMSQAIAAMTLEEIRTKYSAIHQKQSDQPGCQALAQLITSTATVQLIMSRGLSTSEDWMDARAELANAQESIATVRYQLESAQQ